MMTMPKCSSGVIFKHDKSYAVAQTWSNLLCLWVCRYLYTPTQFLASDEMVYENMIKETDKDKMKLEYKFYEKNLAPKWLEGDYDLHIEGNRMTMTSKDSKKVEARCHPDDDWRLQIGIDELKERMSEAKKPREIKVGDKVVINHVKTRVWTVKYIDKAKGIALIDNVNCNMPWVVALSSLELVD